MEQGGRGVGGGSPREQGAGEGSISRESGKRN